MLKKLYKHCSNSTIEDLFLIILHVFREGNSHSNSTKRAPGYGSLAILIVMAPLETLQSIMATLVLQQICSSAKSLLNTVSLEVSFSLLVLLDHAHCFSTLVQPRAMSSSS